MFININILRQIKLEIASASSALNDENIIADKSAVLWLKYVQLRVSAASGDIHATNQVIRCTHCMYSFDFGELKRCLMIELNCFIF